MTDNRTTELREKLTERGVEYTTNDHLGAYETSWNGFTAMQLTPGAKLMMVFTPEQAIVATLGNSRAERTCHNVSTTNNFRCSECDAADLDFDKPSYCHGCGCKVVGE